MRQTGGIERIAELLASFRLVPKWVGLLLLTPWNVDNGLLTSTTKVNRGEVERRFGQEVRELYAGHTMVA